VLLVILGLISFGGGSPVVPMGDGAVAVSMISLDPQSTTRLSPDIRPPEEMPEEAVQPPEEMPEEVVEQPEEIPEEVVAPPEEIPEEVPEENPVESVEPPIETPAENPPQEVQSSAPEYATLSGSGTAGAGMPGPGTYESRVFNAIRRGFRTSVEPDRSYRIVLTILPDGTREVQTVRTSGITAFDRAVENALELAQIPPMPPGRDDPVVIQIEFLGPE